LANPAGVFASEEDYVTTDARLHAPIHKVGALVASFEQEGCDCVAIHASHAADRTKAVAFDKAGENGQLLFGGERVHFVLAFRVKASQNVLEADSSACRIVG